MLGLRTCARRTVTSPRPRGFATLPTYRSIPILDDGTVATFRNSAFTPALPALLPRDHFGYLSAVQKWFKPTSPSQFHPTLDQAYLETYSSTIVPLELTSDGKFAQIHESLGFFLKYVALYYQPQLSATSNQAPQQPSSPPNHPFHYRWTKS